MLQILAITCILGSVYSAPATPLAMDWSNWYFYPTQGNQFYYLYQKPMADPISRSEVKLPLTANLLCASIPFNRQSGNPSDFNEAAQQAAGQAQAVGQAIADQIQAGASSVSSQIQDAIANSQSQIQDALGGAGNAFDQLVPGSPPLMNMEKKDMMFKPLAMPTKDMFYQPMIKNQQQLGGITFPWPEFENRFYAFESPSIINLPRLSALKIRSVNKDIQEIQEESGKTAPVTNLNVKDVPTETVTVTDKNIAGNVKE